jgi:Domain of unknown function (DUF4168)
MRLALPSVTTLAAGVAAVALFALPAAAASGTGAPAAPAPTASAPPTNMTSPPSPAAKVSDQKLGQAATAMEHVMSLRKSYEAKLDNAAPQDKPRIEDEGQTAMKKAVTDQGLSIDEYNSILVAARSDPTLRAKLLAHVKTQQ